MDNTHLDPGRAGVQPTLPASSSASRDPAPELRSLGEFRVLRPLGEGGMGAVYLGYDGKHVRHIALKVLNDKLASNQGYVDRFYREAQRRGARRIRTLSAPTPSARTVRPASTTSSWSTWTAPAPRPCWRAAGN